MNEDIPGIVVRIVIIMVVMVAIMNFMKGFAL